MNDLREAAQQALEALEQSETFVPYEGFGMARREAERKHQAAITALRAALAQQDEPVQEPYTGDVTRIMRDAGMIFHLGLPHKAVVEQMTRVVDLVYAEASIKAAQQFAAALAQQAEPAQEPVAEVFVRRDGVSFAFWLKAPPPERTKLYTAPPQRKPLTEEEIDGLVIQHAGYGRDNFYAVARAVERAHGIKE